MVTSITVYALLSNWTIEIKTIKYWCRFFPPHVSKMSHLNWRGFYKKFRRLTQRAELESVWGYFFGQSIQFWVRWFLVCKKGCLVLDRSVKTNSLLNSSRYRLSTNFPFTAENPTSKKIAYRASLFHITPFILIIQTLVHRFTRLAHRTGWLFRPGNHRPVGSLPLLLLTSVASPQIDKSEFIYND